MFNILKNKITLLNGKMTEVLIVIIALLLKRSIDLIGTFNHLSGFALGMWIKKKHLISKAQRDAFNIVRKKPTFMPLLSFPRVLLCCTFRCLCQCVGLLRCACVWRAQGRGPHEISIVIESIRVQEVSPETTCRAWSHVQLHWLQKPQLFVK